MSEKEETMPDEFEEALRSVSQEYDGIQDPETAAHQVWETTNWLFDSLEFNGSTEDLQGTNDIALALIEHSGTQVLELHHTFPDPLPAEIVAPVRNQSCDIRDHQSKFDKSNNRVETAVWIVPNAFTDEWESPEFRQFSSYHNNSKTSRSSSRNQEKVKPSQSKRISASTARNERRNPFMSIQFGVKLLFTGVLLQMSATFLETAIQATAPPLSVTKVVAPLTNFFIEATGILSFGTGCLVLGAWLLNGLYESNRL
jgi:hypothetical protein